MRQLHYLLEQDERVQEKQFCECLKECMDQRSRYLHKDTWEIYKESKKDISKSFQDAVKAGVEQAGNKIISEVKSLICYIHISYLLSGALTGEHKVKIDFYDHRYFGDMEEVDCLWDYQQLFPSYNQELFELEKELRQAIPRLTAYKLQRAKIYYQVGNFIVLEPIIQSLMEDMQVEENLKKYFSPVVKVFYGAYLDQSKLICQWGR